MEGQASATEASAHHNSYPGRSFPLPCVLARGDRRPPPKVKDEEAVNWYGWYVQEDDDLEVDEEE